jgi:hypothetical protein
VYRIPGFSNQEPPRYLRVEKGNDNMQWELIVALVIAIPIILFPAAYVWYLNIGGIYAAIKEARARRAAREVKNDETIVTE